MMPKLPRHYRSKHVGEIQVKQMIALDEIKSDNAETKLSKKRLRNKLIAYLKKRGIHVHNMNVLSKGRGELVVEKRPTKENGKSHNEYLPCEYCFGWYFRKDLHRHIKSCSCRTEEPSSKKGSNRIQSFASMMLPVSTEISSSLRQIFEKMKVDEISTTCKVDETIIKFGNKLCHKHANNDDQSKYISNKLRELGRITIKMKAYKDVSCLNEVINPKLFAKVVKAVSEMCGWDEESKKIKTPSLGIKLGQLLGKIASLVATQAIQNGDVEDRRRAKDFILLLDTEWNDEIGKRSRTELETRKWNKPQLIPLTEDLQKLKMHLNTIQEESMSALKADKFDISAYRDLATSTLAKIMFNRRRQGEPAKLKAEQLHRQQDELNEEIKSSLSPFEQKLCSTLKRYEVRGKRGRKVPLLLTLKNEEAIKKILEVRDTIGVSPVNPYVFAVASNESTNFIRGNDALRKHVLLCDLERPDVITSTKLRKHIATLTQLLNLEERELEMLANYMGHDIAVHREYYRLPEHTLQVAKVGKLLTMLDEGKSKEHIGKSLDEINIDLQGK